MSTTIDSSTRVHFLIGDPIAQVIGPTLISERMSQNRYNGLMLPLHVAAEDLEQVLTGFDSIQNLDSVLITVPHKIACVANCTSLSSRAQKLGAINVMRRDGNGGWYGDNFDGPGFVHGLTNCGHDIKGKKAFMAGAGGAGSSIAVSMLDSGLDTLTIFDIKTEVAEGLVGRLLDFYPRRVVHAKEQPELSQFQIVINATSTGLRVGDPLPMSLETLKSGTLVADVITNPAVTPFMAAAEKLGAITHSGTEMLDGQLELLYRFVTGETVE
ncbi:shikimate dehydrogenase [Brucella pseudogrignonensis]|uniref:shikimate dehydrogenase family protein n=1 Tax=Brucella pseudogrignonensis TaxID=419475 RepID=UPI0028B58DAF|nr:shikimate dehydrogenase [Brucella pseudogrignonensis]MDT6942430.1 shikimate dehydrogenase [Brucella pseudogrignonensis]